MTPLQLRDWRIERKLTLPAAAELLGCTLKEIVEYESGAVEIPRKIESAIKFMP